MADGSKAEDEELQGRQGAKLFPVGQALRATYDAENHASLSKDVTGLMLDLARVPFEPHDFEPVTRPAPTPARPGWIGRLSMALIRMRRGR